MAELTTLDVGELTFDVRIDGPSDGPVVLLLHGFPNSSYTWRHQLPVLAGAGYRAVAPDQRGYSPGARPPEQAAYGVPHLLGDVTGFADAVGAEKFHLVGHDWGGQLSWLTAAQSPERLRSLTVLSRPHPTSFKAAYDANKSDQQDRSKHHRRFHDPDTVGLLLEDDARRLRRMLNDLPTDAVEAYVGVLGNEPALTAAISWYREARLATEVPTITVPTMYIWGDADFSVSPEAAHGTAAHVDAEYRFEILPDVGHFATDEVSDDINRLLLDHLENHR